ncbi:Cysteine-rich CWC [Halopseudomonas xinjiangensis]|uniref:Cysteine-rich CWC n=1 Tax=Halopseudomonas xinjiangensis TaxID=487184 RepID=A0A1H1VI89_9GAMM|nr:Cysteine-rich CWC [Halopseudomonas xinjiangensis]
MTQTDRPSPIQSCPLCGSDNACQPARTGSFDGDCWCKQMVVDAEVLQRIPDAARDTACLCQRCASGEAE